jgi:hypothetical protein
VTPDEWMRVIDEIGGLFYIEASTDNEIDPLICSKPYIKKWTNQVLKNQEIYKLKVFSLFSGYVTYRSIGLTHPDADNRKKLIDQWFKKTIDIASGLDAEVGCNLCSFTERMLSDELEFQLANERLLESLSEMARYAKKKNVRFSFEQMYTPTQGFWTITECRDKLKSVLEKTKTPMYITLDTGHHTGQKNFLRQDRESIKENRFYAEKRDTDIYEWIKELGRYSPILHLQQSDGMTSSHRPFTEKWNKTGTIFPERLLASLKESYEMAQDCTMPAPVENIHLVFEPFFSVTESAEDIIRQIRETVQYWRKFIPRDDMPLDEIIKNI